MRDREERATPLRVTECRAHFTDLLEIIDCSQGTGEGALVFILRKKTRGSETLGDLFKPTRWIYSRVGEAGVRMGWGVGAQTVLPGHLLLSSDESQMGLGPSPLTGLAYP